MSGTLTAVTRPWCSPRTTMYVPRHFRVSPAEQLDFIERYPFATLITAEAGVPFASHLPLLLDRERGRLIGHMARANDHWRLFDGEREALAIFAGPHSYISPRWYAAAPAVPTWNYTTVHVYGRPVTVDDATTAEFVERLTRAFERSPLELPDEYRANLLRGIVGFEAPIRRTEGKFKLGQNRTDADQQSMLDHLERGDEDVRALAAFIREVHSRD